MKMVLHAADISSIAKPDDIFNEWGQRIRTEFDMQIQRENELGFAALSPGLGAPATLAAWHSEQVLP